MPKTATKTARRDVDGTVPGVCVMTVVRLDPHCDEVDILVSYDRFIESDDRPDPEGFAQRFWDSLEADWPGCKATFTMNERARYLMTKRRMEQMLGVEYTVDTYLEGMDR